jgi:hypothetical protein
MQNKRLCELKNFVWLGAMDFYGIGLLYYLNPDLVVNSLQGSVFN